MTLLQNGPTWRARTVAVPDPGPLEDYLLNAASIAWLRRGEGMIGLGVAERVDLDRLEQAEAWWNELVTHIEHETELTDTFGAGPLAFGSFTFDPDSSRGRSVLVVPKVILGRRGDTTWLTTLTRPGETLPSAPARIFDARRPIGVDVVHNEFDEDAWVRRVADAVGRIAGSNGALAKVVLARAVQAHAFEAIDPRWLVGKLASDYPSTWTFHVDGMVGASPELLVRSQGGLVTSRVLAGTIRRGAGGDEAAETTLARSEKDQVEHAYAVASVTKALVPFCSGMNVPESPYVLRLPNVMHLASDVTGVAHPDTSVLELAAALHPSAAVCGTPTVAARATIAEIEGLDRGRYAGPIGWVDTAGEGEWAIALRCGRIDPADARAITLYAGCGIVAQSDPQAELAETRAKLIPMLTALDA